MDLVLLIGSGAVGKMTVGQQLMKITDYRLQKVFAMHPEAAKWRLDTILEEKGNCHLYEKCGFKRVGKERPVNEKMTLIDYEKEE